MTIWIAITAFILSDVSLDNSSLTILMLFCRLCYIGYLGTITLSILIQWLPKLQGQFLSTSNFNFPGYCNLEILSKFIRSHSVSWEVLNSLFGAEDFILLEKIETFKCFCFSLKILVWSISVIYSSWNLIRESFSNLWCRSVLISVRVPFNLAFIALGGTLSFI